MRSDHGHDNALMIEMPIYDGSEPVEHLLPDWRSRSIYCKLLRELANLETRIIDEAGQWMEIELALKSLMIAEYMEHHGIEDITEGIRQFDLFRRRQLAKLSVTAGVPFT